MSEPESDEWLDSLSLDTVEYRRASYDGAEDFMEAFTKCTANDGYDLVTAAIAHGYDIEESGRFEYWFFDYLGDYLSTAQPEYDDASDAEHLAKYGANTIDETIGAQPLPGEPFYPGPDSDVLE